MKRLPLLLGILLTAAVTTFADEQFNPKIKVTVAGSVEASSFILRELRTLRDVEIVSTNQDYSIGLVVLETKTKGNTSTGFAISCAITQGNSLANLLAFTTNRISDETARSFVHSAAIASKSLVTLVAHEVRTCGPDDLRKECENIVARFDSEHLEPARQSWKQIQDLLKTTPRPTAAAPIFQGAGPPWTTNSTPSNP